MKTKIEQWFKENKSHFGKWSLIGKIAEDLNIETFEYGLSFWNRTYPWNNDIAKAINELIKEEKIKLSVKGRGYLIEWNTT